MKNTITGYIDKKNISIDEKGHLSLKCSREFKSDMKNMYGLDVQSQEFLRHIYFGTLNGKFSVTVPNKIAKRK